jgi:hypothetical protein
MTPSSKSKESATARVLPTTAGARIAGKGVSSPTQNESPEKFIVWPVERRERIATKAYELWEQRGCRHGHHLQDWFDAEAFVIQSLPAASK